MSLLLEISGLTIAFGQRTVVEGVSLSLDRGRTLGLVGESGSGKTLTALACLGLLPEGARVVEGSIRFAGEELVGLSERMFRPYRGARLALVPQDPLAALNPVHRIGDQVAEALRAHRAVGRREAWREAVEALRQVGLPDPAARARNYPHQLSGGQRQRVMLAMAIICRPALLLADEPTTALDVSVQAQILALLKHLQAAGEMGLLLITHDLGVIARMADEVAVMRAGRIIEQAPVRQLFASPGEAYTRALLAAIPRLDRPGRLQPAGAADG